MATIVAAAGGGNWTTGSTWVGGNAPTAADDAQLTGTSGNVTIDAGGAVCRSLDCTGYTGTLTHNAAATLTIGDATAGAGNVALKFVAGMTYTLGNATTSAISFVSTSATVQTVDFASKTTGNITFNATSNGSWQYTGTHNTGATTTVTLTKGALDINGQTCSWGLFSSSNSNTRTLTLGPATITITGGSATVWDMATATGLTVSAANTSCTITYTGASPTLGMRGTYNDVTINGGGTTQMNLGLTCRNYTLNGTAAKTDVLSLVSSGTTITCTGTLTLAGNSVLNRILVQSSSVGTARTLNAAAVSISNCDFMDVTGAGAASWNLSAITGNSGDCGGNTNITFTTPATQTWSGTSGGNWSANAWTSRVPLPQDDVIINAAFSASQTVTADMPRLGKSIDWTGTTGNPTWSFTGFSLNMFGSLNMTGVSTISGSNSMTLRGRGTHTITSAGKVFVSTVAVTAPGGSYTLQDAFSSGNAGNLSVTSGTFDANNQNVTCISLQSTGSATRSLTMGSGTWTFTRNSAATVLSLAATGLTFSGASATMVISAANSAARTFDGAGFTFGTLNYTVAGSTGSLTITGANTFDTINFSDASNARTLTLPASTTTTVTHFNARGTAGKLMTINSSSSGTAATLSSAKSIVSCDYLSIQDSTATGGAAWYAGANSTNVSGNTGWLFVAAPTSGDNFAMMGVG